MSANAVVRKDQMHFLDVLQKAAWAARSKKFKIYATLGYIMDGKGDITTGDKTSTVNAGEMLIMPANVPHALHAVEEFKMLLVMIRS